MSVQLETLHASKEETAETSVPQRKTGFQRGSSQTRTVSVKGTRPLGCPRETFQVSHKQMAGRISRAYKLSRHALQAGPWKIMELSEPI